MMRGRSVKDYDPNLRGIMVGREGDHNIDTESWADMMDKGRQIHIIEDDDGPAAVMTYTLPNIPIVIGETLWIRPDLRGETNLFDEIVQDVLDLTKRNIALAHASIETLERYRELYTELRDNVFIHVRSEGE